MSRLATSDAQFGEILLQAGKILVQEFHHLETMALQHRAAACHRRGVVRRLHLQLRRIAILVHGRGERREQRPGVRSQESLADQSVRRLRPHSERPLRPRRQRGGKGDHEREHYFDECGGRDHGIGTKGLVQALS
jgi:hypothetical protein